MPKAVKLIRIARRISFPYFRAAMIKEKLPLNRQIRSRTILLVNLRKIIRIRYNSHQLLRSMMMAIFLHFWLNQLITTIKRKTTPGLAQKKIPVETLHLLRCKVKVKQFNLLAQSLIGIAIFEIQEWHKKC